MQENFLQSRGIYYRTNEIKEGRETLLFVHGLSGSASAWLRYEKYFEQNYNVVTFDLRAHGKSRRPRKYKDYAIKEFVKDIKELVDHLHLKHFVLVSHSLGAIITLEFIRTYPDLPKAVVLISPSSSVKKTALKSILKPFGQIISLMSLWPFWREYGKHIDYKKFVGTGDWNLRRMRADITNTGIRAYLYCLKQVQMYSRERFIKDIKIPTLIIHGTRDTVFPISGSEKMARQIPHAQFIKILRGNHILVLNNFYEVATSIDKFLQKSKDKGIL